MAQFEFETKKICLYFHHDHMVDGVDKIIADSEAKRWIHKRREGDSFVMYMGV